MAKHIVYPHVTFTQFVDEPILKRLALFFDQIFVQEGRIEYLMAMQSLQDQKLVEAISYEQSVWQFLQEKGIVKTYPF